MFVCLFVCLFVRLLVCLFVRLLRLINLFIYVFVGRFALCLFDSRFNGLCVCSYVCLRSFVCLFICLFVCFLVFVASSIAA